jgi:hypothetical protein
MKLAATSLAFIALLVGCTFARKKTPPPPPPPVAVSPPAPQQPLSIPQTSAQLPSPQPVNPDAIPPAPAPAPPPEKPEASPPRPARHVSPRPEAPAEAEQPAQPAADAPAPAPFQPILSAQEQARLKNSIDARRREIEERLKSVKRPSAHDQGLIDRINSFVNLSSQAAQRGDFTQADALLERASILARELGLE